jgi:hypothetical protein
MNSKLKVFTTVLVTFAVLGALLAMPLTGATLQASEDEAEDAECAQVDELGLIWWLLNNSEPEDVEGAAVSFHKDMLMVNTDGGQKRIALPEEWTVGSDLMTREMLFGSGYLSVGENVTVRALRAETIEKEGLRIYVLIGYEIVDDASVHAYAAIPLNIET